MPIPKNSELVLLDFFRFMQGGIKEESEKLYSAKIQIVSSFGMVFVFSIFHQVTEFLVLHILKVSISIICFWLLSKFSKIGPLENSKFQIYKTKNINKMESPIDPLQFLTSMADIDCALFFWEETILES